MSLSRLVDLRVLPLFFFFNDTATTEIYTLSLHDALPISFGSFSMNVSSRVFLVSSATRSMAHSSSTTSQSLAPGLRCSRSEEHTSELQSQSNLVCRLLLEKKKDPFSEPRSSSSQPVCTRR